MHIITNCYPLRKLSGLTTYTLFKKSSKSISRSHICCSTSECRLPPLHLENCPRWDAEAQAETRVMGGMAPKDASPAPKDAPPLTSSIPAFPPGHHTVAQTRGHAPNKHFVDYKINNLKTKFNKPYSIAQTST